MKVRSYIERLKRNKSWRTLVLLLVGFSVCVILDILVKTTGNPLFPVKEDFPNEVFGATCGVAVLGNAMLSLLFGASDKMVKGIPFQDILRYSKFGCEQQLTIIATTFSIVLAVFAYSNGFCTTLTFLICFDAILILTSSVELWNLLSDEKMQAKVINDIIEDTANAQYVEYVENWFNEMIKSLDSRDEQTIQQYSQLLDSISATTKEAEHPINNAIAHHLPYFFEVACEKIGFVAAYKLFKSVNHIRPEGFVDCETVALEYIGSLSYCDSNNVHNRSIPKTVETIVEEMGESFWERKVFAYQYFCAVINNPYLGDKLRDSLAISLLNIFATIRDSDNGDLKKEILLNIIKHEVILNTDEDERGKLFEQITEALLRHNRYVKDSTYIGTVAEIFRAFFFYIYRETETLSEDYRHSLLKLFQRKQNRRDLQSLSFGFLIADSNESIINWLAEDAVGFDFRKSMLWDYFSPMVGFKSIVWSEQEVMRFAFCFYKLIGYIHGEHPFVRILNSDECDVTEKVNVCSTIVNFYENGVPNENAKEIIGQIEELTGINKRNSSYRDTMEHSFFQDKLMEYEALRRKDARAHDPINDDQMLQLVIAELQKENVFKFNSGLSLKYATRRRIEPNLVEVSDNRASSSAYGIAHVIRRIMNDVISRKLRTVTLDFKQEGVRTLLSELGNKTWGYCNYLHINDYAIPSTVRETEEFRKLCDVLNSINYDRTRTIYPYVFLKDGTVQFRIELHYSLSDADEEKCAEYVKRHQIAEGVYRIGPNSFDYSHAIKYVRQNYKLETVDFAVRVDVNNNSGFVVEFSSEE